MEADPVIAGSVASWPGDTLLEERVFGTASPVAITAQIDGACREWLGAGVACALFAQKSIGVVYGLRLLDGRRVVAKGHGAARPTPEWARLAACTRVQGALCAAGFPAPRPLAGPLDLDGGGSLTLEELVEGEAADAHVPAVRRALAEALAALVRLARPLASDALPRPWWMAPGAPTWPPPHSHIFDLGVPGGKWIDDLAGRARGVLAASPEPDAVVHGDWGVKNALFRGTRIVAVLDWDSLRREPETHAVGHAASHFAATWHLDVPKAPSLAEVESFLEEYEAARGGPFSAEERRRVGAGAVHATAYTARCEHGNTLTPPTEPGEFTRLLPALARWAGV